MRDKVDKNGVDKNGVPSNLKNLLWGLRMIDKYAREGAFVHSVPQYLHRVTSEDGEVVGPRR
jgi:hypothetical protein